MTPGGDAPGMNTAIRAVVRTAIFNGLKVYGVEKGLGGADRREGPSTWSSIRSAGSSTAAGRSSTRTAVPNSNKKSARKKSFENLQAYKIEGLVVIGGDGSLKASHTLSKEFDFPIVNIPASIDNDIYGTDYSIGFDTAVNTAVEAIDKIRDTATSHERVFVIEVMGRNNGFIALDVGLVAGGSDHHSRSPINIDADRPEASLRPAEGKIEFIIVVAEGAASATEIAKLLQPRTKLDVRVSILGQSSGAGRRALYRAKWLASWARAVMALMEGRAGCLVGGDLR